MELQELIIKIFAFLLILILPTGIIALIFYSLMTSNYSSAQLASNISIATYSMDMGTEYLYIAVFVAFIPGFGLSLYLLQKTRDFFLN